jgi:uncharacterized protein (TIGR02453 family)
MLTKKSLDFLKELSKNNNREWFHANKKRYEADLKLPFEEFISDLIEAYKTIDPEIKIAPKEAVFRIYRDTRFSKDKTPYKTHVGALISRYGRKGKDYPGHYIHIESGRLMLGGGAYFLERGALQTVREHIARHSEAFTKIINKPEFKDKFETVQGDKHKRIPKEFKELHETLPLIANKQFYYMAELPPKKVLGEGGVAYAMEYFKAGEELNKFMREAMGM